MKLYVNHRHYGLMIPIDVLEALGKPKHIEIWNNIEKKQIAIYGYASPTENSYTVSYYTDILVFPGGHEITENVKHTLQWGNSLYAADCFLAKDHNKKIVVVADLNTAVPTDPVHGPFSLPVELNDDEDFDEDEDYDE